MILLCTADGDEDDKFILLESRDRHKEALLVEGNMISKKHTHFIIGLEGER